MKEPQWEDAPTCPGMWVVKWEVEFRIIQYYRDTLNRDWVPKRYYGPLPNDDHGKDKQC